MSHLKPPTHKTGRIKWWNAIPIELDDVAWTARIVVL
jgi:hypothetical protein